MRKPLGAVLIGLTLLGAGCAGPSLPLAKGEPEGVNQSATTTTYTEPTTGLTFDYPSAWGEVRVSRELPAMDTGKRLSFGFTENDRISMTAASADYSEGVGEGTPGYFTLRGQLVNLASASSAAKSLRQEFDILTWERVDLGHFRMVHNGGLGGNALAVSHLLTTWSAPEGFSTLMVNVYPVDFRSTKFTAEEAETVMAEPAFVELNAAVEAMVKSIRLGSSDIASWKQTKLGFVIRLPETWRASEVDAGGVSLIRVIAPGGSEKNPAAEIFVQLSKDMEGNAIGSFEQWVGNGGRADERLISKSVADGSIVIDGVTFQKRIEDDSTIAYYAQLETNNGVYFRYAYASKHPLKSDLEGIIRQMRFSPSADEFGRARVIP